MKKNSQKVSTFKVRELVDKYQANCDRINDIADLCEKEERERSEAEEKEFVTLCRENQLLQMRLQVATSEHLRENPNARDEAVVMIRENAKAGRKTEILFVREFMMVSDVQNGGIIPLNIQDILQPLEEGFILHQLGLPMPTGLAGDFVWPVYEMVEATVLGEGVALTDSKIPFSKLTASPERIGIAVPVTNQTLNQTQGILETIIKQIMPKSIQLLLNKIVVGVNKVNNATHLVGPFVALKENAIELAATPTFKELNLMKAQVLETGIEGSALCWVMSKSMKAILEGTPINDKGIFIPMIQNNILCGLPVYTSNAIRDVEVSYYKYSGSSWEKHSYNAEEDTVKATVAGQTAETAQSKIKKPSEGDIIKVLVYDEYIGLGDFRYQPMGLFGSLRFIVDPYSQARKDSVDFVLNADYATKTLRPEAFALGKVAKA